ncbi:MAG: ATP-binding cassette domain-containing protein [Actinomycetes bacterium]
MSAKRQIPVGQRRSTRAGGGELRLTRVSFRYPNSDRDAVHDLTLAIPLGTRVAIVGHSGAGKSTLGDLMLGLLDPTSGDFRVVLRSEGDSTHSESGIHGLVTAFVSQDVYLAPTTIRANVALSVPGQAVDEEEVWQALRLAQVDDVVAALPEGVDTVLGERGARLSGGQRQRIGLARALFREPQMLVLDEATSSLDAQTEHSVTEAIEAIPGDITVVLIAHRLATVRSADLVLYLADGILIEAGSFDELVAHHPDLARSARLQGVG